MLYWRFCSIAKIKIVVNKKKEVKKEEEKKEPEKPKVTKGEDGIYYIDGIMIVNKSYPLPSDYNPGKLLPEFMNAYNEMIAAATEDGIKLWIQSGFRSYDYQVGLYDKYVREDGREKADTYSARPGYSEHQSGLGHIRYVGKVLANKIHDAGDISLEHYFDIESKYSN